MLNVRPLNRAGLWGDEAISSPLGVETLTEHRPGRPLTGPSGDWQPRLAARCALASRSRGRCVMSRRKLKATDLSVRQVSTPRRARIGGLPHYCNRCHISAGSHCALAERIENRRVLQCWISKDSSVSSHRSERCFWGESGGPFLLPTGDLGNTHRRPISGRREQRTVPYAQQSR